ncbi:hypothetical protein ACHAXR_006330, partial [Thalassiosira sp. AJA248-18]
MVAPISIISTIEQQMSSNGGTPSSASPSLRRMASLRRVNSSNSINSIGSPEVYYSHSPQRPPPGVSTTPLSISTEYVGGGSNNKIESPPPSVSRVNSLRWTNSGVVSHPSTKKTSSSGPALSPPLHPSRSKHASAGPASPPLHPSFQRGSNRSIQRTQQSNVLAGGVIKPSSASGAATPSLMQYSNISSRPSPTQQPPKQPSSSLAVAAAVRSPFDPSTTVGTLLTSSFAACGADELMQLPKISGSSNEQHLRTTTDQDIEYNGSSLSMKESNIMGNRSSDGIIIANSTSNESSSSTSSATPTMSECDYDTNPTELYLAVQNKHWDLVVGRSTLHPSEVATWVTRKESDGMTLRWRLLPLHAAIVFEAPLMVIGMLISAFGHGAQCKDDQGKLPIHLCFRRDTHEEVLELLLRAYPGGMDAEDDKGRTPLVLARQSNSSRRDVWVRMLEGFVVTKEAEEGGGGGRGKGLSVNPSANLAASTMPYHLQSGSRVPKGGLHTATQKISHKLTRKQGIILTMGAISEPKIGEGEPFWKRARIRSPLMRPMKRRA